MSLIENFLTHHDLVLLCFTRMLTGDYTARVLLAKCLAFCPRNFWENCAGAVVMRAPITTTVSPRVVTVLAMEVSNRPRYRKQPHVLVPFIRLGASVPL